MKKHVSVNGDLVRKQREKRAWTQEELSERANLGVRTVRRLEAGNASWENLLKVAEHLDLEPESTLVQPQAARERDAREWFQVDPIKLELSTHLLGGHSMQFVQPLLDKLTRLRESVAREWGWMMPGIRICDSTLLAPDLYRVHLRELPIGEGTIRDGQLLVMKAEEVASPCWSLPANWVTAVEGEQIRRGGGLVLSPQSVIVHHLRSLVELHAHRLLGLDEVAQRLERLDQRRLVQEVIPARIDLVGLRWILRQLLREFIPIRDLPAILESVADHPGLRLPELYEKVRADLAYLISHLHADSQGVIVGHHLESLPTLEQVRELESPVLVTTPELRPSLRVLLSDRPRLPVLSTSEVAPGYRVVKA
ncbi:MAG: FHIPEP family type III secretion protein [Candidatus Eremiobacteraeota bacterium]|nr:FHIPEP family type III secretion protein [Candidatus Eremiobacteraeota bacterium]